MGGTIWHLSHTIPPQINTFPKISQILSQKLHKHFSKNFFQGKSVFIKNLSTHLPSSNKYVPKNFTNTFTKTLQILFQELFSRQVRLYQKSKNTPSWESEREKIRKWKWEYFKARKVRADIWHLSSVFVKNLSTHILSSNKYFPKNFTNTFPRKVVADIWQKM